MTAIGAKRRALFPSLRNAFAAAFAAVLFASPVVAKPHDADVTVMTILAAYERATHATDTKTFVAEGTIAGEGLVGTFHTWRDGDREREDDVLGPRSETTLRLGDRVFIRNPNGNVRELHGFLRRRALTDDAIASAAFVKHPEFSRFVGWGDNRGKRVWRLEVTAPGGEPETLWIDPESGLPVQLEYLDGDGQSYIEYSDWRNVRGHPIAFRVVQTDGDRQYDVIQQTTSVTMDAPVDASLFAPLQNRTLETDRVHDVPLIERNGHVGVMVRVAGRDWFFLLDTGSQSILVDQTVLRAAGVDGSGAMEVRGAARSGGLQSAVLPHLAIDGMTMSDVVVSALDLSKALGSPDRVDGILGYPFFASGMVEMDFAHKRLRFGPPGSLTPQGTKIPLDVDRELAEAPARVNESIEAPFIIDTGNSGEMLLYRPFIDTHRDVVPLSSAASWNIGIGGSNATYRTQLDALTLGGMTLYRREVNVVLAKNGAFADRIDAGNVGLGILKNFDVTFDFGDASVYLQPNKNFDDGRYRYAHAPATRG